MRTHKIGLRLKTKQRTSPAPGSTRYQFFSSQSLPWPAAPALLRPSWQQRRRCQAQPGRRALASWGLPPRCRRLPAFGAAAVPVRRRTELHANARVMTVSSKHVSRESSRQEADRAYSHTGIHSDTALQAPALWMTSWQRGTCQALCLPDTYRCTVNRLTLLYSGV